MSTIATLYNLNVHISIQRIAQFLSTYNFHQSKIEIWPLRQKQSYLYPHLIFEFIPYYISLCLTIFLCMLNRSSFFLQIRIRRPLLPDRPARVHLRVLPSARRLAVAQTTDFAERLRRAAFRAIPVLQVSPSASNTPRNSRAIPCLIWIFARSRAYFIQVCAM